MQNAWWLDLGRLSMGFGVGLICYVVLRILQYILLSKVNNKTHDINQNPINKQVSVYIAEISPKELRGRFTSASQVLS